MMDTVLEALLKDLCNLDDILVMGASDEKHLDNLEKVSQKLHTYGIWANKDNCQYLSKSVE